MKNTARLSCFSKFCSTSILVASIFMSQAHAVSLQVAPILLEFYPNEKVKELWLTNTGTESIRAQVRVNQWIQENQKDVLTTSKNLIASPMVLTIPAEQRQLVRLIRNSTTVNSEEAYRLIVDELPNPQEEAKNGLQVLLKYSIPVFFKTSNDSNTVQGVTSLKDVNFVYSPQKLTVTNQSGTYVRFSKLAYIDAQGKQIPIQQGLVGYVLNGQTMEWSIPNTVKISTGGKFMAVVNSDVSEQTLPLLP